MGFQDMGQVFLGGGGGTLFTDTLQVLQLEMFMSCVASGDFWSAIPCFEQWLRKGSLCFVSRCSLHGMGTGYCLDSLNVEQAREDQWCWYLPCGCRRWGGSSCWKFSPLLLNTLGSLWSILTAWFGWSGKRRGVTLLVERGCRCDHSTVYMSTSFVSFWLQGLSVFEAGSPVDVYMQCLSSVCFAGASLWRKMQLFCSHHSDSSVQFVSLQEVPLLSKKDAASMVTPYLFLLCAISQGCKCLLVHLCWVGLSKHKSVVCFQEILKFGRGCIPCENFACVLLECLWICFGTEGAGLFQGCGNSTWHIKLGCCV